MANETNKKDKRFFKDFKAELKKVIWPTSKQLVNNTTAVIVIVLIIAAIVFALDVAFESMNTYGIDKIKSLVTSTQSSDENLNNEVQESIDGVTTVPSSTTLPDVITDEVTINNSDDTTPEVTENDSEDTVENEE